MSHSHQLPISGEENSAGKNNLLLPLVTISGIVFLEFLIMGISLGVIPAYVHSTLGYGNLLVGVVIGTQYAATLFSRHAAGRLADSKGGKRSVTLGIILSCLSGLCCLLSYFLTQNPLLSLGLLIMGRILLGIGESFVVIGIFTWGFIIVGPAHTGRVMVWNGIGMYGGMACGAPLGMLIASGISLPAAFAAIALFPILSYLAMLQLRNVALPASEEKLPFYKAVLLVWRSGTGLALSSIGFGTIASFITLYFLQNSWSGSALAITAFGFGYVIVRPFCAHYPDKFGGGRVAFVSLLIEIIGQLLIYRANSPLAGILGAGLTGLGMSLVFPSFGNIAVKKVSPANRGMAMAAYNSFFDLGMGLTAPLAGLISSGGNYSNIYLFGAMAALISALLAFSEIKKHRLITTQKTINP